MPTLPATTVMAATSMSGWRSAIIRATASSEAVSVSMIRRPGADRYRNIIPMSYPRGVDTPFISIPLSLSTFLLPLSWQLGVSWVRERSRCICGCLMDAPEALEQW